MSSNRLVYGNVVITGYGLWWALIRSELRKLSPKSKLGAAISYAVSEWPRMRNYLKDGMIEIDNNATERAIKPFVIGRKNWLFCDSENGAFASAVLYSLLQSAKANDLPIHEWLTYVLEQWPKCTTDEQRLTLAPHRFDQKLLNFDLQDAVA